jgi:hypothetical protein
MTDFSLQVTSMDDKPPLDSNEVVREGIAYWDQELASTELQVAMNKMSWPTCFRSEEMPVRSRPSKRFKA